MPRKTFVIGHRNPDTNAIVSAIAYAGYLKLQGEENVVAAALGQPLSSAHSVLVEGVISRKKQVVPILPQVTRAIQDSKR